MNLDETRFLTLAVKFLDGSASKEEAASLNTALENSEEARVLYLDLCKQASALTNIAEPVLTKRAIPFPLLSDRKTWQISALALGAAAALIVGIVSFFKTFHDPTQPNQEQPMVAAEESPAQDLDLAQAWMFEVWDVPTEVLIASKSTEAQVWDWQREFASPSRPHPVELCLAEDVYWSGGSLQSSNQTFFFYH